MTPLQELPGDATNEQQEQHTRLDEPVHDWRRLIARAHQPLVNYDGQFVFDSKDHKGKHQSIRARLMKHSHIYPLYVERSTSPSHSRASVAPYSVLRTMRADITGHFKPCMTEIYIHIDARMAD